MTFKCKHCKKKYDIFKVNTINEYIVKCSKCGFVNKREKSFTDQDKCPKCKENYTNEKETSLMYCPFCRGLINKRTEEIYHPMRRVDFPRPFIPNRAKKNV